MEYPARIALSPEGQYVLSFRDMPETVLQYASAEAAHAAAPQHLLELIKAVLDSKRKVPMPSPALQGEHLIRLALSTSAKVLLLNEMIAQQVSSAKLAKLLHTDPCNVIRLVDIRHSTKLDTIDQALQALGKSLQLQVR